MLAPETILQVDPMKSDLLHLEQFTSYDRIATFGIFRAIYTQIAPGDAVSIYVTRSSPDPAHG